LSLTSSARLPALGEVVVTIVVVALFFERVDYILYLQRGFPIPDLTFVVAGLLLLVYGALLACYGRLDLRRPSWTELTVVALIVVLGLTSVAAALAAHPPTKSTPTAIRSIPARPSCPRTGAEIFHCHFTPRERRPTVVFPRFRIQQGIRSYAFAVLLRTTSKPVLAAVGLKQSRRTETRSVETTKPFTVLRSALVSTLVTVSPAAGAHTLEPLIVLPTPRRATTLVLANPELRITRHPVFVRHFGQSAKTILHFAYFALIALLLGRMLTPALMRRALETFFVCAVAVSVVAALQALDQNALHSGATGALHLVSRGGTGFIRPVSVFSEPALLGYFALLGLLIGLRMHARWGTRWVWVGMGFCLLAILLAAAAGPIVALVPVALYVAWRASRAWRRFWRQLIVLVLVGIAVLVFLPAGKTLTTRASAIISGSDNSARFRYAYDAGSIRTWRLAPLTGVGAGNTRYYMPALVDLSFDPSLSPLDAQFQSVNSYLGTLAESGVFGLLMLATMLVALFWPFGGRRREDEWLSEAAILLFIVSFFFISAFAYPIFWFWVGFRLAELRGVEPEGSRAPSSSSDLEPMLAG
jgi:O-antigen ligase